MRVSQQLDCECSLSLVMLGLKKGTFLRLTDGFASAVPTVNPNSALMETGTTVCL